MDRRNLKVMSQISARRRVFKKRSEWFRPQLKEDLSVELPFELSDEIKPAGHQDRPIPGRKERI